jgi:hypothetical protein
VECEKRGFGLVVFVATRRNGTHMGRFGREQRNFASRPFGIVLDQSRWKWEDPRPHNEIDSTANGAHVHGVAQTASP